MIKFRLYSKYDDTDQIKSSTDSSILNKEEKGKMGDSTKTALLAGAGAILGGAGKKGASKLIGTAVGVGLSSLKKANKEARENAFYNRRLKEAKRAARRREKLDWENRIHYRGGYE